MKHFKLFEEFNSINEGCWSLPTTVVKATALKNIVDQLEHNPKYVFGTSDHMGPGHGTLTDQPDLYTLLGDDGLFDTIMMLINEKPINNQKIATAIKHAVKWYVDSYTTQPDNFTLPLEDAALVILKTIY